RKSHENPGILKLYEEYLEKPLGHLSHELLHTHYKNNSKSVIERKKELEEIAKG
ncbi:MAG TPA: iron hydrogenase small subunit, partial [Mesotoga sp.]|nr:iron hydrogenase small subunit [Mesotoga sp.]